MSQIVKAFLGVFLTIFMAVVALGVLNTYMEVMSAQDMQARIVDELENSNFNADVMSACFKRCAEAGYELAVTTYGESGAIAAIHGQQEVPAVNDAVSMAKVELRFPMKSVFLGID